MNKKFTIIYTIFASLILVFSVLFFSLNLINEYNMGKDTAGSRFYSLNVAVNKAANSDSKLFIKKIDKIVSDSADLASIQIKNNGEVVYLYPNIVSDNNSRFVQEYKGSAETQIGRIETTIKVYTLTPTAVSYYAKLAFLIVLIITLITIILIIYNNISDNKSNSKLIENDEESVSESEIDTDDSIYMEEEIFDDSEVIPENTNFELLENETSVPLSETLTEIEPVADDEEGLIIEDADADADSNNEEIDLPYKELAPVELTEAPSGLFNPATGIGWESYLNTRLDSEINRAIASEIDLSLFVIELPGLDKNNEEFTQICNYLTIQFQFKDLIFEYKNDCLVAIKISMDLDEALNFSDKLYADIKNIIQNKECYMGISTRSIRMVSGERLLLEAEEALKHSKDDSNSPVVAFRVDTDKYREYMERNQN